MADEQKKEDEEDVSGHTVTRATGDDRPKDAPGSVTRDRDEEDEDVSGHVVTRATGDDGPGDAPGVVTR